MPAARLTPALLALAGIVILPVGLSYGLAPAVTLPWLFGIDATGTESQHVFRAIAGLYLAMGCFWIAAAAMPDLRRPALWSLLVFMAGLALGRLVSILVDGWPHPLLIVYLAIESVAAALVILMLRMAPRATAR